MGMLLLSILATTPDKDYSQILTALLTERTLIIESACYGEITYEEAEQKLDKVVCKPLLETDLEQIFSWNDTELDRVIGFQISSLKILDESENRTALSVSIVWQMWDQEGEYEVNEEYEFVILPFEWGYKIAEMTSEFEEPEIWLNV